LIDAMRVGDDERRFVLTENNIERDCGNDVGREHISQDIARADGRQLVGVADKENVAGQVNRLQ